MIVGIGCDLVELKKIEDSFQRGKEAFLRHVLSVREQEVFYQFKTERRQIEWLSGRFAAKEAYSKAVGTGFGGSINLNDIEVLSDQLGKPVIAISNSAILRVTSDMACHVSITHTDVTAGAVVIIENKHRGRVTL